MALFISFLHYRPMTDHVQGGKKVLLDKTYLVVQVSDNSQEDVSRFISEVENTVRTLKH